jgi:uncharacterized protein (TIGR02145 family)
MQNIAHLTIKTIVLFSVFFSIVMGTEAKKKKAIVFDTIKVGEQVWMKRNLDVEKFRNGTIIPQAKTREEWIKAGLLKKPAWCYVDNDPVIGMKVGKLYNWYAVTDKRGLAPKGWAIPSIEDWAILQEVAKKERRRPLQSDSEFWKNKYEENVDLEDEEDEKERREREEERINMYKKLKSAKKNSLFFAEPAGLRIFINFEENDDNDGFLREDGFIGYRQIAKWWSSSEYDSNHTWTFSVGNFSLENNDTGFRRTSHKAIGYSVRCIQK